jgi:hypothetical protein
MATRKVSARDEREVYVSACALEVYDRVAARDAWIDTQLTMLERVDRLRPGTRIYCREYLVPATVPTYRSPWLPCGDSWKRGIWS